jgi:hypothetical protein
VKNDRLHHAAYLWAFSTITASTGAKPTTGDAATGDAATTTQTGTPPPSATSSTA